MAALFQRPNGPTRINQAQINQSVLGYCVAVVMGRGKLQQTILWLDGFQSSNAPSSGGKGSGGKDGNQLMYSADVIAGLCPGGPNGLLGIGDVWCGQSWLRNTETDESYSITGSTPSYTPSYSAQMTGDKGVAFIVPTSGSYTDLGAPTPTTVSGNSLVPLQRVPYNASSPNALSSGTFSVSPSNSYYFSPADAGQTVQLYYTFSLSTISRQQNALIPSGLKIEIDGNMPFVADSGVVYYSTGSTNPNNGKQLQRVYGTPTVAGTYSVDNGDYDVSGSPPNETVTVNRPASYTFAPGDLNQEVQISFQLDNSQNIPAGTQTSLSFMLIGGTPGQETWALLDSNYPGAALGYTNIALAVFSPMDLGYGAQIQQNVYEVLTADAWGGGISDCNPVQCIMQVLSNPVWGLGAGAFPFPLSAIDNGEYGTWGSGNAGSSGNGANAMATRASLPRPIGGPSPRLLVTENTATAWFAANNFFISPVIDRQDTAASLIGRWLEAGMCAAFMSEGLMKLVAYGDTTTSNNGATWTAPAAFDAQLDDTCFVKKGKGQDPVKISSSPWQDAYNTVQVSWNNRGNQYAPEITPESDKAAILRYGSRIEDPQAWDFITTLAAATFAASMRVKRNVYTRNTYEFSLPFRFGYLEPMGIVSVTANSAWNSTTNNTLQLVNRPVRITKMVDNPDGTYDVTCEDYVWGVQQPSIFSKTTAMAVAQANQFADPGNTQAVVFEATSRLTQYAGNQMWIGANGADENWGGCNVWASMDGDKYTQLGTIEGQARLGTLAAALPTGSDPDTADSLVVNLVPGSAGLESGTQADADQGNTLCYVDGELIAYSACAITGTDQYTAGTYLRRGQMGSSIGAHAAGSNFMRLDTAVLKYTYDPSWYGKTVYLKFQSFNRFGNSAQDMSTLTPVMFTVPGQNPGAFSASSGAVLGPVSITAAQLIQPLVDAGAIPAGTYAGTPLTQSTVKASYVISKVAL